MLPRHVAEKILNLYQGRHDAHVQVSKGSRVNGVGKCAHNEYSCGLISYYRKERTKLYVLFGVRVEPQQAHSIAISSDDDCGAIMS